MKMRTVQSTVNAGELSRLLRGRMDVARYQHGLELCRNALPLVGGGVTRRPGSFLVQPALAAEVWLVPFIITSGSNLVGYMLEFTAGKIRFYDASRAQIITGGVPVEVATPYSAADLPQLKFEMFEDVLYLWHPSHAPRKLTRTTDIAWSLASVVFVAKPFFRPRGTEAITITPGALSGATTLTSSAALFAAGHVGVTFEINGGLFKITAVTDDTHANVTTTRRIKTPAVVNSIEQAVTLNIIKATVAAPVAIVIEFKTQRTASSATLMLDTAQTIPADQAGLTFTLDQTLDTAAGAEIYYDTVTVNIDPALLAGDVAPVIKCTGSPVDTTVATAFTVTATVSPTTLPAGVTKTVVQTQTRLTGLEADDDWQEESWSAVRGWPVCGTFHEQRCILAGTASQPTAVWGSKITTVDDFTQGTLDDEAFSYQLAAAQSGIRQVSTGDRLQVFTGNRELALYADNAALTPSNLQVKHTTSNGCSNQVRPILLGQEIHFVGPSGLNLFSMRYSLERDNMVAPDLASLAEHLTADGGGIIGMAYAVDPIPCIWAVTAASNLLSLTIDGNQDVSAWAKHYTAETLPEVATVNDETTLFKSVAVIPDATGKSQIWLAVARQMIGGAYQTFIEVLDATLNTDCTVIASNAQTVAVPALLNGKTFDVIADGIVLAPQVVAAGQIDAGEVVAQLVAGLHYKTTIKDLPPYIEGAVGSASTSVAITALFHETKACRVNGVDMDFRSTVDLLDTALASFSGWKRINTIKGWDSNGATMQTIFEQDLPLPLTILAISKELAING